MGLLTPSGSAGDIRTVGNYSFAWTKDHIPKETTDPLRHTYDKLSAAAVARIQDIHRQRKLNGDGKPMARLDLFSVLEEHHETDEALGKFWDDVHTLPSWVDWEQLERGQKFFYRYALANLMGFALQGFVGENSASTSVVEVLVRKGGFSTRVLLKRLLETFQFLLEVTHSLEYIKPGGSGHKTAVRVRLLHAMVRQGILKLVETKGPSYFDTETYGIPVNTLDSLHALTTFSCNHAYRQLPLMGINVSDQEVEDYVALWRYIGHILGTPVDEHFTSATKAKVLMESLAYTELSVTETSLVVGHNFVETVKDLAPINLSAGFIEAGSRVLNGDALCDSLGMGRPGIYSYACFKGHCWFVWTLATVQRMFPCLDERSIDFNRDALHDIIIQSKATLAGGTKMEFRHIPSGKVTGKEDNLDAKKRGKVRFYQRPLELFYFACFLIGSFLVFGGSYAAAKLTLMAIAFGKRLL